ncbi:putative defense protein [Ornithodoros turicata]|uniref:putative defense protein n=1 Tax=Ornithodoros turicata TaxID=34597 RepID=UPI00313A0E0C
MSKAAVPALLLVLILNTGPWVHCNPTGAPLEACKVMEPKHNQDPMLTHHPYMLMTERTGTSFNVTLVTIKQKFPFKGFLIRAIQKKGSSETYIRGQFARDTASPSVKFLNCDGYDGNAVTHTGNWTKGFITVHWTPYRQPPQIATVLFRATVLQHYSMYWLNVDSRIVLIGCSPFLEPNYSFIIVLLFATRLFRNLY